MRTRRRLAKELEVENVPAEEVSAHLEGMPADYVLNTDRDEMALHIAFARQARAGVPSVSFHDDRLSTFTEVMICALDDPRPGLLAKIAGVLFAADLTVHAAQVFTRVSGEERIALDTLCVDFRGRRLSSGKRSEIEGNLVAVLTGATTVEQVLSKRRKPTDVALAVEQIRVRSDFSERFTVVELAFTTPQGLLFHAARALSELGWDIHSARMSRFRGRAMATFYVSGARGLTDEAVRAALERHIPVRSA
jgi:[protein-PII] uridylyltransferase